MSTLFTRARTTTLSASRISVASPLPSQRALASDFPTLIRIKEAAGRRKGLEAIAELRVLLEEIEKKQT